MLVGRTKKADLQHQNDVEEQSRYPLEWKSFEMITISSGKDFDECILCRINLWAKWARAQGPAPRGGPALRKYPPEKKGKKEAKNEKKGTKVMLS